MENTKSPLYTAHLSFKKNLQATGRASATVLAYTKDIEQLVDFVSKTGKTTPSQVTADDINAFKADLAEHGYTAKSISRKINSIKSFFRFLIANKEISANPATEVTHPKYELKPPRILSKVEYRALRDACRDDVRVSTIVEVLLQTGIRIGELANLEVEDLDLNNSKMEIRPYESHGNRSVPLNNAAKDAFARYMAIRPKSVNSKHVFVTKTGNQFLVRNIRSSIDRYFRMADIKDAKVNDLRHTFIAHQLTSGTPLVYLSKLVGHKRLSTTEKYLELIKDRSQKDKPKIEEL